MLTQQPPKSTLISVIDVVRFVQKYRTSDVFIGYSTDSDVANYILNCGKVTVVADKNFGRIIGVAIYEESSDYKILHINQILCIHKDALKELITGFRKRYKGWRIQGNRKNRGVTIFENTKKLLRRLEK
jgi:hypothetical protein